MNGCFSATCVTGSEAAIAYDCTNGVAQYGLTDCPVEESPNLLIETSTNSSGSDCSHWAEASYDTELMTPIAENIGMVQPLSRFTVGAIADIWGPVNYAMADFYTCATVSGQSVATAATAGPDSILLYPGNAKDVLLARVAAGKILYEQQLTHLTLAERDEVLAALAASGKTLDPTSPAERRRRERRD